MTGDARFEDADPSHDAPLRLMAADPDDLAVLSALTQDAVFSAADLQWDRRQRRLALLVNRFRWEIHAGAPPGRPPERVRAVLVIGDVIAVASQGFDRDDKDLVLSLLAVDFEPSADGTGAVVLTLAGDGAIRCEVECLDLTLRDVTRPYAAPSRRTPGHPD